MTVCLPQRDGRGRTVVAVRERACAALRGLAARVLRAAAPPVPARWSTAALRQPWWWPAALFPAGLAVVQLVRRAGGAGTADRLADWASTDLDNLGRNPVGSMLASAFVIEGRPSVLAVLAWMALATVGLATLARRWGALRAVALVLAAHVVGTLVSQGVTAWRLQAGLAAPAERYALDVGPSYVVVGALAAGLVAGSRRTRPLCALGLGILAPFLFDGLSDLQVAAVGHLVALLIGAAGAAAVTLVDRARPTG